MEFVNNNRKIKKIKELIAGYPTVPENIGELNFIQGRYSSNDNLMNLVATIRQLLKGEK